MLRAGSLNRRITIQRPGTARNDLNEVVPGGWVDVAANVAASIKTLNGAQTIKADAVTSKVRASIRVRFRTDIDASMRVVHGATVYQVLASIPDEERREHTDLVCEVSK
ncbi:phage head closure protein [Acidovorax sp. Root217]|uniref:phage head closure protein n=1 Tax=Acidovorax sp. Root217 TaxID=1736492 RepID=UPI00070DC37D|nr:phage head closure protein [Acidovorax sp. Root217]KRC30680.1 head-tail adaptor protein [Acidovorax sp. Root217]